MKGTLPYWESLPMSVMPIRSPPVQVVPLARVAGSVPIIGQTLSSASESILAGIQLLKSGLGLAALSVLGAEFVPLYLGLMIQLALLMGCSLLCSLTGISRCRALFDCFAEAVRCMAAVVALFFGLAAAGVALLFIVGGGS